MSKEITDAKRRAIRKYDAANTKQLHLKLNLKTDAAILAHLGRQGSVQGYIKRLIWEDMNKKPNIVLCKYCKHHGRSTCSLDDPIGNPPPNNWFCADGER